MSPVLDGERRTSVPDLIGRAPLLRLRLFEKTLPGIALYAKVEWGNQRFRLMRGSARK